MGKLPPDVLAAVLTPLVPRDSRVWVGPRVGEDAAVIDLGDRLLVAAADPITFATDEIGRYVVAVNANDVAVRGATPRWLLATVLLPPGTTPDGVHALMTDLGAACRMLGIDLIGGHTEVTDAVVRPLVAGTMLGEVQPDRLVTTGGAYPDDMLLLGGVLAIEGTTGGAYREGGLATALSELAVASGVGLQLDAPSSSPILPQTRALCTALGLDPLGLLASGALLVAVTPADVPVALAALERCGAGGRVIGRVTQASAGLTMADAVGSRALPVFDRDELARWLDE